MEYKDEQIIQDDNIKEEVFNYIKLYDNFLNKISLSVIRKCQKLEFEDTKQQIILVLFTNTKNFQKSKEAAITTYFSRIALNAANNIIRQYWQKKNKANIECVSLDSYILDNEEDSGQLISTIPAEETLDPENYFLSSQMLEHIKSVTRTLTTFEKKVFSLYMGGCSVEQISSKMKKSKKTVYNTLSIIKDRIRKNI